MKSITILSLAIALCISGAFSGKPTQASFLTDTTERVSVSSGGEQGNDLSDMPSISANGRYVAFGSYASNLVPGDTNGYPDVFVHDRQTGSTQMVSVSSNGEQGNLHSVGPSISANGRFVAFFSGSSNLVEGDTNSSYDIFVHDRQTHMTERISVSSSGAQANSGSYYPSISSDGRYVAFESYASNLVEGDTNGAADVFVHDRQTGSMERVSVSSSGGQGNAVSWDTTISGNGRYVAFVSDASNLVQGDTNGFLDIFVHDSLSGETRRVSVSSSGEQANSLSGVPAISADGNSVAFGSFATNLVEGDNNAFCDADGDGSYDDNCPDIFVHDTQSGETTLISVSSAGEQGNMDSCLFYGWRCVSISQDGRYVAFHSHSSNLVEEDTNDAEDVFIHDRQSGTTWRISVSSGGEQGNSDSSWPSISANGLDVAFMSSASNLVEGDTNSWIDVFVHSKPANVASVIDIPIMIRP